MEFQRFHLKTKTNKTSKRLKKPLQPKRENSHNPKKKLIPSNQKDGKSAGKGKIVNPVGPGTLKKKKHNPTPTFPAEINTYLRPTH